MGAPASDATRRALTDRAAAARDHARAVTAYEADLTVVRETAPGLGRDLTGCRRRVLDARERVTHLAVLLVALVRVADGHPARADRDLLAAPVPPLVDTARGNAPPDAIRALLEDATAALGARTARRAERRVADASPAELAVIGDLVERGLTYDHLVELLDGAHLLVPGRELLDRWRALDGARPRPSSHYRDLDDPDAGPQLGIAGRFTHEILFGPGPHGSTFVQLERAAPSHAALPRHLADWAEYRATHRNQGPYGASAFTDTRPLRLTLADLEGARDDAIHAALTARVDAIATDLAARASVLEPELSLAPVVGLPPVTPAYPEALHAAIEAFTAAAASLRTLAAAGRDAGPIPGKEPST